MLRKMVDSVLKRGKPLPSKRAAPRRDEGRITHQRTKPKAGAVPTAEEKRHMDRIAGLPCLVCGVRPVTLHHVSSDGQKRIARSHKLVTPLCARHHLIQHGPRESVEALGHAGFYREHWVHLLVEAERLWAETIRATTQGSAASADALCS